MTDAAEENAPVPLTDLSAAHASATLLECLADKLGGWASVTSVTAVTAVTAVYGEPITRDGITVVPVARVGFGFGGGAGREIGALNA